MASLTENRFNKAQPIFDRYTRILLETQHLPFPEFEKELKELFGMGYQELKGVMIDLSKKTEYVLLAARYMEEGYPSVISEFKHHLATLYGVENFHGPDRDEKQKEFWAKAFAQRG